MTWYFRLVLLTSVDTAPDKATEPSHVFLCNTHAHTVHLHICNCCQQRVCLSSCQQPTELQRMSWDFSSKEDQTSEKISKLRVLELLSLFLSLLSHSPHFMSLSLASRSPSLLPSLPPCALITVLWSWCFLLPLFSSLSWYINVDGCAFCLKLDRMNPDLVAARCWGPHLTMKLKVRLYIFPWTAYTQVMPSIYR